MGHMFNQLPWNPAEFKRRMAASGFSYAELLAHLARHGLLYSNSTIVNWGAPGARGPKHPAVVASIARLLATRVPESFDSIRKSLLTLSRTVKKADWADWPDA